MVMVHYLDSGTPHQRAATLARLEALRPPTRNKLVEIADVDGSPVAVTLFLSSFVDFATWLDSVSADQPAPPPLPSPAMAPAPRSAGDFTGLFGKVDDTASDTQSSPAESNEGHTPTLMMEPVKLPRSPKPKPNPTQAPPPSEGGFTAIFGRLNVAATPPSNAPNGWPEPVAPPSIAPPSIAPPSIAPLAQPASENLLPQPIAPPPAFSAPAQPGEFTQLFQRISPAAGSSVPSFASAAPKPFRAPETARPIETMPAADLPPASFADPYLPAPLAVPSLGGDAPPPPMPLNLGAPASLLGGAPAFGLPPAPNFSDAPPAPNANGIPALPSAPAPVWGACGKPRHSAIRSTSACRVSSLAFSGALRCRRHPRHRWHRHRVHAGGAKAPAKSRHAPYPRAQHRRAPDDRDRCVLHAENALAATSRRERD